MDLDLVLDEGLLEATHQKVEEFAGVSDRGGRAPDYRKMLIEHEHGELGTVLGWRGQKFTGPAAVAKRPSVFTKTPKNLDVTPNRDPEKGRTVPNFVGGDGKKRTPAQKAAAKKKLADILAEIEDI